MFYQWKELPRPRGACLLLFTALFLAVPETGTGSDAMAQTLAAATPAYFPPGSASGVAADPGLEATAKRTRFIIGLDKKVGYSVFALANRDDSILGL